MTKSMHNEPIYPMLAAKRFVSFPEVNTVRRESVSSRFVFFLRRSANHFDLACIVIPFVPSHSANARVFVASKRSVI